MVDGEISPAGCAIIMTITYVLKWYHGTEPRYGWFIRGILPDRRFFGEITMSLQHGGKQVNVEGRLSESDYATFISLVNEVKNARTEDDSEAAWQGMLAEGPVSRPDPHIIFRYRPAQDETSASGQRFLQIVDLLTAYLHDFYETLA